MRSRRLSHDSNLRRSLRPRGGTKHEGHMPAVLQATVFGPDRWQTSSNPDTTLVGDIRTTVTVLLLIERILPVVEN